MNSLTATFVWFQMSPPFPQQTCVEGLCVCACPSLALCACVSFRPQTVPTLSHYRDRWAAVMERASGLSARDGSLQQGEEMQIFTVTFLLQRERFSEELKWGRAPAALSSHTQSQQSSLRQFCCAVFWIISVETRPWIFSLLLEY